MKKINFHFPSNVVLFLSYLSAVFSIRFLLFHFFLSLELNINSSIFPFRSSSNFNNYNNFLQSNDQNNKQINSKL